jgi:hypothetical protein
VLEDDRCLDVGDLRLSGERPHGDVAKVIGVTNDDMDQEVVVTCHVIERHNLG